MVTTKFQWSSILGVPCRPGRWFRRSYPGSCWSSKFQRLDVIQGACKQFDGDTHVTGMRQSGSRPFTTMRTKGREIPPRDWDRRSIVLKSKGQVLRLSAIIFALDQALSRLSVGKKQRLDAFQPRVLQRVPAGRGGFLKNCQKPYENN